MSCEHCQDHLLDLVYDEADSKDEAALRAHVEGCASCQASFDQLGMARRFAGELPLEEPSAGALDAILAAARAQVGADEAPVEAGQAIEATLGPEPDDDAGLWASIMRWAGSFAMGPQVAMATIMLLVVSTGLWYFPNRRHSPEATGSTVMSPDLGGEAGPTSTLTPADPLDLRIDERARRIRAGGEMPASPRQEALGALGAPVAQAGQGTGRDGVGVAESEVIAARDDRNRGGLEDEAPADQEDQGRGGSVVAGELAELDDGYSGRNAEQRQQAPGAPSTIDSDSLLGVGGSGGSAGSSTSASPSRRMAQGLARPENTAPSAAPQERPAAAPAPATNAGVPPSAGAAPAEPAPANAREAYARGMQRFQRGNYWGAAEDFNRVYRHPDGQQGLVPSALHHMARSHRRASSCRTAVTHYSSLLSRYPSYSGAPRAMIELADCYRTLGRLGDARRTLEGAQRHASVASEARRELLRVDQMQRAQRRMGSDVDQAAAAEAY